MNGSREMWLVGYRAVSDAAGKGAFFLVTILAARLLTERDFGLFSLGTTLGWMAAVATDFGMQMHVARAVAHEPDEAGRVVGTWLRARIWTSAAAVGAVALWAAAFAPEWPAARALTLFVLLYVVSGLIEFLHYVYRGRSRSDIESTLTLLQRAGMLAFAAAALLWTRDVALLAVAMLAPSAAVLAGSWRIAARMTGATASLVRGAPRPAWSTFRRDVMPIGLGVLLSALYFRVDIFLVEIWRGTEAVARYNAVFRLVDAMRLFPAAVLAVALPGLCRSTDLRPLVRTAAFVTASALAASLVLWVAAGVVVDVVYGARYVAATPAFRILLVAFPLMALNAALTHQLIGWDGHGAYAAAAAAALAANVGLNARLIPALSIEGAAWSTVWTEVVLSAVCLMGLRTALRRARLNLVGATGMVVAP